MTTWLSRILFASCVLIQLSTLAFSADSSVTLMRMNSGPSPRIICDFQITVNAANELTGVSNVCSGENLALYGLRPYSHYSLDEVRAGVVFMRQATFGVTVITVSGPELDAKSGGMIRLHYLTNAAFSSYEDFFAEVAKVGKQWVVYSDADNGRHVFDQMNVTTYLLGIKSIEIN